MWSAILKHTEVLIKSGILDDAEEEERGEDESSAQEVLDGDSKGTTSAGKSKVAVADMCLAVRHAECFGLLGENGAGKSE